MNPTQAAPHKIRDELIKLGLNGLAFDPGEKDVVIGRVRENLERLLGDLERELEVLSANRNEISKRMATIKHTVKSLNTLFGTEQAEAPDNSCRAREGSGLTNLCRGILRSRTDPVTLAEVLGYIQEHCPQKLVGHKRPQNSLRVILKRLVKYGDAIQIMNDEGAQAWKSAGDSALSPPQETGDRSGKAPKPQ